MLHYSMALCKQCTDVMLQDRLCSITAWLCVNNVPMPCLKTDYAPLQHGFVYTMYQCHASRPTMLHYSMALCKQCTDVMPQDRLCSITAWFCVNNVPIPCFKTEYAPLQHGFVQTMYRCHASRPTMLHYSMALCKQCTDVMLQDRLCSITAWLCVNNVPMSCFQTDYAPLQHGFV